MSIRYPVHIQLDTNRTFDMAKVKIDLHFTVSFFSTSKGRKPLPFFPRFYYQPNQN